MTGRFPGASARVSPAATMKEADLVALACCRIRDRGDGVSRCHRSLRRPEQRRQRLMRHGGRAVGLAFGDPGDTIGDRGLSGWRSGVASGDRRAGGGLRMERPIDLGWGGPAAPSNGAGGWLAASLRNGRRAEPRSRPGARAAGAASRPSKASIASAFSSVRPMSSRPFSRQCGGRRRPRRRSSRRPGR